MEETTKYALREISSGKLLGFSVSSNEGADFSNDTETTLDTYSKQVWYAATPEQAEYVRQFPTPWYNAVMETPNHFFKAADLEVVKVEVVERITAITVSIPTVDELIELRYRKTEPAHADYLKTQKLKSYDFYMLKEVLK